MRKALLIMVFLLIAVETTFATNVTQAHGQTLSLSTSTNSHCAGAVFVPNTTATLIGASVDSGVTATECHVFNNGTSYAHGSPLTTVSLTNQFCPFNYNLTANTPYIVCVDAGDVTIYTDHYSDVGTNPMPNYNSNGRWSEGILAGASSWTHFANGGIFDIVNLQLSVTPACSSNLTNTSWSDWTNISACGSNSLISQQRSLTTYDLNSCVANTTTTQYQNASCTYVYSPAIPLRYYPLAEASCGNSVDLGSDSLNATCTGLEIDTNGWNNTKALRFRTNWLDQDGTGSHALLIPLNTLNFGPSNSFSVAYYYKINNYSGTGITQLIFAPQHHFVTTNDMVYTTYFNNSGKASVIFRYGSGSTDDVVLPYIASTGGWQFNIDTYNGTSHAFCHYSTNANPDCQTFTYSPTPNPFHDAWMMGIDMPTEVDVSIDQVRIFNSVLESPDINYQYQLFLNNLTTQNGGGNKPGGGIGIAGIADNQTRALVTSGCNSLGNGISSFSLWLITIVVVFAAGIVLGMAYFLLMPEKLSGITLEGIASFIMILVVTSIILGIGATILYTPGICG